MNDENELNKLNLPVMDGYTKIPTFKLWVANRFPYMETDFDALTNYELLTALVDYLNNVIKNEETLESNVSKLNQAYLELFNYVKDYFNNLDVQEEINNKLDDLVEDGTLTRLIGAYVQPLIDEQNQEISEFKTSVNGQIAQQNAQIKAVESGSPLVASSVQGMTDTSRVYVNTTDGHWYYYNGTAWANGGVYQATGIADNSVTLDKIDFNTYLFTNYRVEHKYLTGISYSQHKPTWSEESSDYYGVDFEIPANVDYLIYPYTNVNNFGAIGYNETSNQYGYTNQNIIKNAYSEFNYNNSTNEVKLNLNALRSQWTRIALNLSPNEHNIRFITKNGSDIVIPLTKFIGKDNIKDGAISYEKCDNNLKELITGSSLKQIITVKQDGTGDFTTLNSALASLKEGTKYEIQIYEGTYNVSDYWTEKQLNNANYPNGFYGEVIPNGCDLVGIGNRDNIIIHAELSSSYDWNTIRNQISTLNILGNSTLKNITVSAKDLRYAIHDDFTEAVNKTHNYKNCKIYYYNDRTRNALGIGARNGLTINIEDCEIEPSIGYHTNVGFTTAPILNIKNTIIKGMLNFNDYNSGIKCPVNFENVKYTRLSYNQYQNNTQYIELKAFNNSLSPVIQTVEFNYDGDEFIPCLAINNITKGQPVKRSQQDGVTSLASTDNNFNFFGIAVENIRQYVYGSSRTFGKIQTKGYITSSIIGLSNLNVNDKIGITNGNLAVVSDNPIGIVDFIVDDVAYIRLFN